jgi:hypothetical protein
MKYNVGDILVYCNRVLTVVDVDFPYVKLYDSKNRDHCEYEYYEIEEWVMYKHYPVVK